MKNNVSTWIIVTVMVVAVAVAPRISFAEETSLVNRIAGLLSQIEGLKSTLVASVLVSTEIEEGEPVSVELTDNTIVYNDDIQLPEQSVRFGATGLQVAGLQDFLRGEGYYQGDIDGRFLFQTKNAVKKFQRDHELDVDGVAGALTYQKITDVVRSRDGLGEHIKEPPLVTEKISQEEIFETDAVPTSQLSRECPVTTFGPAAYDYDFDTVTKFRFVHYGTGESTPWYEPGTQDLFAGRHDSMMAYFDTHNTEVMMCGKESTNEPIPVEVSTEPVTETQDSVLAKCSVRVDGEEVLSVEATDRLDCYQKTSFGSQNCSVYTDYFNEGVNLLEQYFDNDDRVNSDRCIKLDEGHGKQQLTLLYPNHGETIAQRDLLEFRWFGGDRLWPVYLSLINKEGTKVMYVISDSTDNDGTFKWRVPSTIEPGEYLVYIEGARSRNSRTQEEYPQPYGISWDYSDTTFTIIDQSAISYES